VRPLAATLLAIATILGGCASSRPVPPVVDESRFSSRRYLLGTGEGDGEDEARRRAYAAIAMQLQADLRATERVEASWSRSDQRDDSLEAVSQEIRVTTRFDRVDWIRTLEVTSEGGRFRVLCMLDRDKARADLDVEIEDELARLRPRLASVGSTQNLGGLSRALRPLRAIGSSLAPKLALRNALAGRVEADPEELRHLQVLEARLEALRREQVLSLCVDSKDTNAGLVETFGAAIAAKGWAVAPCRDEGLRLEGVLRFETASFRQPGGYPWFCTASVAYRLVDPATGHAELGGSRRALRAGGMSEADACRASVARLAADVAGALDAGPE